MSAPARWRSVGIGVRFASAARLMHEHNRRRLQEHGNALTTASDAKALEMLKRWQQGDETMYEEQRLAERFNNRTDEGVRTALNIWWTFALQTMHDDQPPPDADSPSRKNWLAVSQSVKVSDTWSATFKNLSQTLSHDAYVAMFLRIHKALLDEDDEWDEVEAEELIEEAWLSDTKGRGDRMSRTEFNDSLFELAECVAEAPRPVAPCAEPRGDRLSVSRPFRAPSSAPSPSLPCPLLHWRPRLPTQHVDLLDGRRGV